MQILAKGYLKNLSGYGKHAYNRLTACCPRAHRISESGKFSRVAEGLRKREAARTAAAYIDPHCNRSQSFVKFRDALIEATA